MANQKVLTYQPAAYRERTGALGVISSYGSAIISVLLVLTSTLFWFVPLVAISFLKLVIPVRGFRLLCSRVLNEIAMIWISINNFVLNLTKSIEWDVSGMDNLRYEGWYLVLSNHQSWTDILVLQRIFNRRIPFLKFFLKKELIWVPILGFAWWALDFPFMRRYSKRILEKKPHLKGKDIEITRNACKKFSDTPVSVMNFVEGTRFTPAKHEKQQSPFTHLLRPKAGGVGFVLTVMGRQLKNIVNVTILYPGGKKSFGDLLMNRIRKITVVVDTLPITEDLLGDYTEDPAYRERFQEKLNRIWLEKDRKIESLTNDASISS